MRKRERINHDVKNSSGLWVKSYTTDSIEYTTRAGVVWGSMTSRCKSTGKYPEKFRTYKYCENHFESFQKFADWCHTQAGYFELEGTRPWCLDKDILVTGNKIYSAETCCFVPSFVNSLFVNKVKPRKQPLPLGVTPWGTKYSARCNTQYGRLDLGVFPDKMGAHKAWQLAKVDHIKSIAVAYLEMVGSREDVYSAILSRAHTIEEDCSGNRETFLI